MGYQNVILDSHVSFLVTGGAGFIGSNLCEALLKLGCKVRCLDNFSSGKIENISHLLSSPNFELIRGDICHTEDCLKSCQGITYVLHQAAIGSVPRSLENPLLYTRVNVLGTQNIFDAALKCGVKRVVYASSSSVYGDSQTLPKKEGGEGEPLSPYAMTKQIDEKIAHLYQKTWGLDTIGLRYFNVFGRRQNIEGPYAAVIPKFINCLLENQSPLIFGDGNQTRDFTYIENVIEANLKACFISTENGAGQVFNIAYGSQIKLSEVYDCIAKILSTSLKPKFMPSRQGDILHSYADITKAKQNLNYSPDYDFYMGIKETIEWYAWQRTLA